MSDAKWVLVEDDDYQESTPAEECSIGIMGHRWVLSINEGSIGLGVAEGEICPPAYPDDPKRGDTVCENAVLGWTGTEMLEMGAIPVRLEFESGCANPGETHINGPCDHGYWWNLIPEAKS